MRVDPLTVSDSPTQSSSASIGDSHPPSRSDAAGLLTQAVTLNQRPSGLFANTATSLPTTVVPRSTGVTSKVAVLGAEAEQTQIDMSALLSSRKFEFSAPSLLTPALRYAQLLPTASAHQGGAVLASTTPNLLTSTGLQLQQAYPLAAARATLSAQQTPVLVQQYLVNRFGDAVLLNHLNPALLQAMERTPLTMQTQQRLLQALPDLSQLTAPQQRMFLGYAIAAALHLQNGSAVGGQQPLVTEQNFNALLGELQRQMRATSATTPSVPQQQDALKPAFVTLPPDQPAPKSPPANASPVVPPSQEQITARSAQVQNWLRDFNNPPHLVRTTDAAGLARISIAGDQLRGQAKQQWADLVATLGADKAQRLVDAFFFGHQDKKGLVAIAAVWKEMQGSGQPLRGDVLAVLVAALGNFSRGALLHDIEHLAISYGTTQLQEKYGRWLDAAREDNSYIDRLAAQNAPLHTNTDLATLVKTKLQDYTAFTEGRKTLGSLVDVHAEFDRMIKHEDLAHQSPLWLAAQFYGFMTSGSTLSHLSPEDVARVRTLIAGKNQPATDPSLLTIFQSKPTRAVFDAQTTEVLARIQLILDRASQRALPSSSSQVLDALAREVALKLLLARAGLRFEGIDLNSIDYIDLTWTAVRDRFNLAQFDFAADYERTYVEVRQAMQTIADKAAR